MLAPPFDFPLEQPVALDISATGCFMVLDRGGNRLCVSGRPPEDLASPAVACRFLDEHPLVLFTDGRLRTPTGEYRGPPAPLDFAIAASGSVYILSAGLLTRVGESPLTHAIDGTHLAVESGGVWVAGATRAVRLQPIQNGLVEREALELPAPARSAAMGPDGALYVLLDEGDRLLRAGGSVDPLRVGLTAIARAASLRMLFGCGPDGLADLTMHVPPAGDGPDFTLPACSA